MNQSSHKASGQEMADWIAEVTRCIESLRYGSIEITIHDGRVTQIERREKVRFQQDIATAKPTVKTAAKHTKP